MQIVIDIDDNKYHTILNHAEEILDASSFIEPKYLYLAVINGTPLPKEHGDLIDVDALIKQLEAMANNRWNIQVGVSKGLEEAIDIVDDAPTIIEAESEDKI